MVTELVKGVYWVGVVDWGIRHFHGHELSTHRGTTYNSYLIVDEKIALVDTVWGPFQERILENIREVVDPAKIDIVVASHSEPDHSGGLPAVMRQTPQATVVVSPRGEESVEGHYHQPWKFKKVKTGEKISLGGCEMVFVEAPMLHWPDSMFTYLTGKEILMPNDAFGQHYATAFRFNDQVDPEELHTEALKYYANILTPFSSLVAKKIEEVLALKLPVKMIAPSHGVIWRQDPLQIVKKYQEWAAQVPERSAVIFYDTMWEGTRRMAEAVGEGLAAERVPYKLFPIGRFGLPFGADPLGGQGNLAASEVFLDELYRLSAPTIATEGSPDFVLESQPFQILQYGGDGRDQPLIQGGRSHDDGLGLEDFGDHVVAVRDGHREEFVGN